MLIGYMRVSTGEQNLDLQRDALEWAGCERIDDDSVPGGRPIVPALPRRSASPGMATLSLCGNSIASGAC